MEYCEKGDLFQKITHFKKNDTTFEEKEIWSVLIQILLGLKALHDRKIFHRDLKSANIFLCKNGAVKIGDMNVSKIAKKGLLYTQTGTPYYASPEVWKDKPYDHKSDIWSLGCIIYEMCTLRPPFRAENMEGLYKKVVKGIYDKLPSRYSPDLSECIKMMLHLQPNQRADCAKLLSLNFVKEKLEDRFKVEPETFENSEFLQTIKIPENLIYLTQNLPKANYEPIKLRKTTPDMCSLEERDMVKPLKNIFLSLNVMSESKEKNKEQSIRMKQQPTHLPVLKNNNLAKIKGVGQENVIQNNSINHSKLKSIDHKKRVDLLMHKREHISSLDYVSSRNEKRLGNSNKHKATKNIKLDPIK